MHFSPTELHIPDGFLSVPVALIGWVVALVMVAIALRKTKSQFGERQIPLMGILAAFIFAAQAINFPIAGGTSGHLLGGALAAIVLGPWAATLVMTAVIAVQGLFFQDGGLLVMGWNLFNMGVLTAFSGYAAYRLINRMFKNDNAGLLAGAFLGAWVSVEAGAMATALELAASGSTPFSLAFPAMAGLHALIGLGEALITVGAIGFLLANRPDVLPGRGSAAGSRSAKWVAIGLLIAMGIALLSPIASSRPDGLERVAADQGFLDLAREPLLKIFPDYKLPIFDSQVLTTVTAVGLGTLIVFGVAMLVGWVAARRQPGA
jgi:cobalt/nickel transport system permease protein